MITLIGTLLGFIGAAFPELLKLFRDTQDRKHELSVMKLQMDAQEKGHTQKLDEINTYGDIAESLALNDRVKPIGIEWVDALAASVRPVITYAFFILYVIVKCAQFFLMMHGTPELPWLGTMTIGQAISSLWTSEDQGIFSAIIAFWFGSRTMAKFSK